MKNIIFLVAALSVSSLAWLSCNKAADNTAALLKADSIANAQLTTYRHSLDSMCMADVMAQAQLKADSMMKASSKKGGSSSSKKTTTDKGGAPTSVSDREGSQQGAPTSVTDRQGTKQEGPKSVKDRSGATQTPPKQ